MTRDQCRFSDFAHSVAAGWFAEALYFADSLPGYATVKLLARAIGALKLEVVPLGLEELWIAARDLQEQLELKVPNVAEYTEACVELLAELRKVVTAHTEPGDVRRAHGYFDPLLANNPINEQRREWRKEHPEWRSALTTRLRMELNPFCYRKEITPATESSLLQIQNIPLRIRTALRERLLSCPDSAQRLAYIARLADPASPGLFDWADNARRMLNDLPRDRAPSPSKAAQAEPDDPEERARGL
jgi:hypothetical protein